jgi:hypothetical protein
MEACTNQWMVIVKICVCKNLRSANVSMANNHCLSGGKSIASALVIYHTLMTKHHTQFNFPIVAARPGMGETLAPVQSPATGGPEVINTGQFDCSLRATAAAGRIHIRARRFRAWFSQQVLEMTGREIQTCAVFIDWPLEVVDLQIQGSFDSTPPCLFAYCNGLDLLGHPGISQSDCHRMVNSAIRPVRSEWRNPPPILFAIADDQLRLTRVLMAFTQTHPHPSNEIRPFSVREPTTARRQPEI